MKLIIYFKSLFVRNLRNLLYLSLIDSMLRLIPFSFCKLFQKFGANLICIGHGVNCDSDYYFYYY